MALYGLDDDDVVISGVSISAPGCPNFEDLSTKLVEGLPIRAPPSPPVPAGYVGELPLHTRMLERRTDVDRSFFALSKPVADSTSYQTRRNYERAYEALFDAGLHPDDVKQIICQTTANNAYGDGELLSYSSLYSKNIYRCTGSSRAMEASRIAFVLGATGATYALDAGTVGGLQGFQIAYHAVKNNVLDMAIVFGGSITTDPLIAIQMNDLGFLSKDGKTRVFDEEASGFYRSDFTAAFVVQRARGARRVYAKIDGISVQTIPTYPCISKQDRKSWETHLKDFYTRTQIPVENISYLEAYGSGIKEQDTEELNAVANFFCEKRNEPLYVGSVKSNLGFCDGGSDYASVAKALICFQSGYIPANANYSSPNRSVKGLINGKIKVVDKKLQFPENGLIAISTWSFGSYYGHMVLSPFKKAKQPIVMTIPRLVPLTSRTSDDLSRTIHAVESAPYDPDYYAFITDLFRKKIDRFLGRGYVVLPKKENSISLAEVDTEEHRPLWFVFSGMGSQWNGMGKGLLELPITRESLLKSHRVLEPHGVDLQNILTSSDPTTFDNILNSFVGISAIQIALVDLMRALKVEPDGIIGHSVGEFGCAYCDGTLTAEQMILCAYYRGRASLEATLIKGFMAAIGKGYNQLKDSLPEGVVPACHNSSTSCTISGPADIVAAYVEKLQAEGVFARTVNVANIAYHSPYIQPAIPIILNYLKKMIPNPLPRSAKWISTSIPEVDWDKDLAKYSSAEYHTNNFSSQVLFEEGCRHIPENAVLVELAPHGLLQAILKRSMGQKALNISLTNRDAKDPLVFLLEGVGKMFTAGVDVDINAMYPPVEYPVSRGTLGIQPLFNWVPQDAETKKIPDCQKVEFSLRKELVSCDPSKLGYYIVGKNLFPFSVYIFAVDKLHVQYNILTAEKVSTTLSDVRIHDPTKLSVEYDDFVEVSLLRGNQCFEISTLNGSKVLSGDISWQDKNQESPAVIPLTAEGHTKLMALEKDGIYSWFKKAGYSIPSSLQALTNLTITQQGLIGQIDPEQSIYAQIEGVLQMLILDANSRCQKTVLPSLIQKMVIFHEENSTSADSLEVIYDRAANVLYSSKFFISGVQMKEITSSPSSLIFHSIDTVALDGPTFSSSREFIRFCCNIIERTKKVDEEIKVLEMVNKPSDLKAIIESSMPSAQVLVKKPEEAFGTANGFDLVVCNSRDLNQVALTTSGFILAEGHSPINIPDDFAQVSKFECEKSNQFWLLKKKIVLNGERDFIVIPETKEILINELRNRRGKSSALIVGFEEPIEGFAQYQESIESQVDVKLKWLFILDKDAPEFNVMTDFYQEQLKQGLATNVLINGKWHHVYKMKLEGNLSAFASDRNLDLVTDAASEKLPMMGIKRTSNTADLDPILSWPVPSTWSEEEAQLVPFVYSMAYYCLVVISDIKNFDRVLITDGMSAEGQAALAVALPRAGRVFTSVGSAEEALQLQKLFPSISKEDIIYHSEPHMAMKLRLVVGDDCPNIVYNFLEGDVFRSCYENIALFGRIFHFGREEVNRNEIINLSSFLRSVSLYVMSRGNILKWDEADKKVVQALVSEGIKTGIVKPPASLKTSTQNTSIQQTDKSSTMIQPNNKQFVVTSSGCYVVVGEDSDHDLDVADWLAEKGAKKIYVCNPSLMNCSQYQQQVEGIKIRRNASIEIFDHKGLKEAMTRENIKAAFVVHLGESCGKSDPSLLNDIVETKTKNIVTISKNQEYVSQVQKIHGIRAAVTNIIWNVNNNLLGQSLNLMEPFFGLHHTILVDSEVVLDVKEQTARYLHAFIPDSLDSYNRLGLSLKSLPEFVEVTTLSPRASYKTSCSVFVIPGVEDDPIKAVTPLLQKVLYPAFVAKIPHNGFAGIPNIALSLIPLMKKLSPGKTFNLVGISAGAPIAIEVARQLETQGAKVAVLLFDNPMEQLQRGLRSVEDLQVAILNAVGAHNSKPLETMLRGPLPWQARLNHLICSMDLPPNTDHAIRQAACYVYDRILAILDYSLQSVQIKGPLTVLRSRDHVTDYHSNKLCVMHKTLDVPVGRKAFVQSLQLGEFINKYAITEEMLVKCVDWPELEEFVADLKMF